MINPKDTASVFWLIIILVALGIVGFVGYKLYQKYCPCKKENEPEPTDAPDDTAPADDPDAEV